MITTDCAKSQILNQKLKDEVSNQTHLAVFLLEQKYDSESKYKKYIELLPQKYETNPIYYQFDDLVKIDGSPFLCKLSTLIVQKKSQKGLVNLKKIMKKFVK